MWDIDTPGITTRLRGMCNCEITLKGPGLDLHSGLFGGSALNPINALANVLGDLHDNQGRIQSPWLLRCGKSGLERAAVTMAGARLR